jgi:hypothetical protein
VDFAKLVSAWLKVSAAAAISNTGSSVRFLIGWRCSVDAWSWPASRWPEPIPGRSSRSRVPV